MANIKLYNNPKSISLRLDEQVFKKYETKANNFGRSINFWINEDLKKLLKVD